MQDNHTRLREIIKNSVKYLEIYLDNLNYDEKITNQSKIKENDNKKQEAKEIKSKKDYDSGGQKHDTLQTPILKNVLNKRTHEQEKEFHENEYYLWKAYSWIEYSILHFRIKKYNLMDTYSNEMPGRKKNRRKKIDHTELIIQLKQNLQNLDYDSDSLLNDLREVRNNLKIILKKTIFKR